MQLQAEVTGNRNFCKNQVAAALTDPYVLVFAFLIGMFHWTNYWGFCHLLCDGWHGSDLVQLPEL